ncbi:MAG: hypothetical protein ACI3XX_01120 [Eubacteriales bacterium]
MKEEKKLEYYLAYLTEETLFAHGDYYEFFRTYDKESKQWITSKISFSRLLHDFRVKEIGEEEAKEITGNNLPEGEYRDYCDMLSGRK